jgi:hypothetical protein
MLGQKTVNALLTLKPSGPQSFEDLLRELLTKLTNQPYHLSSSGRQGGVDGVLATGSIGFEAKRYGETDLNVPSLLGQLVRVRHTRPEVELWLLISTGRLAAQDRQELEEAAADNGIALLIFAEEDLSAAFHPMAGLCATQPQRVCEILADPSWSDPKKKDAVFALDEVRAELEKIATLPEFVSFQANLEKAVREIPTWRIFVQRQNQRLKRVILEDSKVRLGTRFDRAQVVPRTIKAELDQWLAVAMSSPEPHLSAVLGERFDGKTWMVLDWLVDRLESMDVPVFFLGSNRGDVLESLNEMLIKEAEEVLGLYGRHARAILERGRRWTAGRTPWCLLILDGLNEYRNPSHPWQRHLSDAFARVEAEYRPSAVLCTIRTKTWSEIDDEVKRSLKGQVSTFVVGPFDEAEFSEALRRAGKEREEIAAIPPSAQELLRRPRFLQLVLEHRDRLGDFEVVNEDVLHWLDASDKLRRDGRVADWTEERYQGVLQQFAQRWSERHRLTREEVLNSLQAEIRSDLENALKDLSSEGVLGQKGSKYTVHPDHLRTGMALYLLDLLDEFSADQQALRERLRDALSPHNEDDEAAAWLRRASVFALIAENPPREDIIDVLVDEWLRSRNRPPDDIQQVRALGRLLLWPLLRLAPRTWIRSTGHRGLQELSIIIFSEYLDREKELIREFARSWCRLVPTRGPSFMEDKPDIEEKVRSALSDRGIAELGLQSRGDSGLLELQNVVLYLESLSGGLVALEDLLAILAAHHIPLYYLPAAGVWVLHRAFATVSRDWFERWTQRAVSVHHSQLREVIYHLLLLSERADLADLVALVEPSAAEDHDPLSHFRTLDRAGYENIRNTPFREEERPIQFLERVRYLVVDPDLPPPSEDRLTRIRATWGETFHGVALQLVNGSTREDHFFQDGLAAIAAWLPDEGAYVVYQQIEDLPQRFRDGNHWWVLSIRRHAVLAEGPARDHLQAAAKTLCTEPNGRIAPGYALQVLIPGMTSKAILEAIQNHCLDFEWARLFDFTASLEATDLRDLALASLSGEISAQKRIRTYFLLTEIGGTISGENLYSIVRGDVEGSDAALRVGALGFAVEFDILGLPPQRLLTLAGDEEEDQRTFAPRYAAWLLVKEGHFLDRLSPYWRAVAAVFYPAKREPLLQEIEGALETNPGASHSLDATYTLPVRKGLLPRRERLSVQEEETTLHFGSSGDGLGGLEEGSTFAQLKDSLIGVNSDLHVKKLNSLIQEGAKERRRRQAEHKTAWSFEEFPQELVDALEASRFQQWIEALLRDERQTWFDWMGLVVPLFRRALRQGHPLAEHLWAFVNPLPHRQDPGGVRYLDRGIDWVLHELSRASSNDDVSSKLLRNLILDARTDRQLLDIALGARCREQTRLKAVLEHLIESEDAEDRARAAMALGWLEGTEDRLGRLAETDVSLWVRSISEKSLETRRREGFARYWLSQFLRDDLSRIQRWGAGQLFLEAVDGTFESWAFRFVRETVSDVRIRGEALLLLEEARAEVKRSFTGSIEKYFLEYKVSDLERGVHPWRRQRSWHELEQWY